MTSHPEQLEGPEGSARSFGDGLSSPSAIEPASGLAGSRVHPSREDVDRALKAFVDAGNAWAGANPGDHGYCTVEDFSSTEREILTLGLTAAIQSVRAVNSHDLLVEALEAALPALEERVEAAERVWDQEYADSHVRPTLLSNIRSAEFDLESARSALASAKGDA